MFATFARLLPIALLALVGCPGCTTTDAHVAETLRLATPIIEKALSEVQIDSAQFAAGVQGINPKYIVEVEGLVVTGFIGSASIGFDGVSGQLSGGTQGRTEPTLVAPE